MTTHPLRRKFDEYAAVTKVGAAIMTAAAVVTLCWKLLAEPCIQVQIEKTTNPIIEVLEYQTFLMMQSLTDEQVRCADQSYTASKKMKVNK